MSPKQTSKQTKPSDILRKFSIFEVTSGHRPVLRKSMAKGTITIEFKVKTLIDSHYIALTLLMNVQGTFCKIIIGLLPI